MELINDFAEQLLHESTSLANYELKERMRETDAIRLRSETSSGAEEQCSLDAVSVAEGRCLTEVLLLACTFPGTIVSFASVEEREPSIREEPEEQASEEATFHDAMINESVDVIPAEVSEYYSAMEETLEHVEHCTTDHNAMEGAPAHMEESTTDHTAMEGAPCHVEESTTDHADKDAASDDMEESTTERNAVEEAPGTVEHTANDELKERGHEGPPPEAATDGNFYRTAMPVCGP